MAATAAIGIYAWLCLFPVEYQTGQALLVEERFFGDFDNATRIVVDGRGRILVIDEGRNSVFLFDGPESKSRSIGGFGWESTTFDRPTGVTSDGLSIYVSDNGNHRIVRYDKNLVFLSSLSTRDTSFAPARFGYPIGVSLSRQGDLYVIDGENIGIVQFDSRSNFVRSFGTLESRQGRLSEPVEIEIAADDRVVILEKERLVEFDYAGNLLQTVGEKRFRNGSGFCFARDGFIVVADDSLLWFDRNGITFAKVAGSSILGEYSLKQIRDVAMWKDKLLVLSPQRVGVFRIESGR